MAGRSAGDTGSTQARRGRRPRSGRRATAATLVVALVASLLGAGIVVAGGGPAAAQAASLSGTVESGGTGLEGYVVELYRTEPVGGPTLLGHATTDSSGAFTIDHGGAGASGATHYLLARPGAGTSAPAAATLATVLGPTVGTTATVNPRTTVATAWSLAQFLDQGLVTGSALGIRSGAAMSRNLADPTTGGIGWVLDNSPNGSETSTRATFNSLANLVAACVASALDCDAIRAAATPVSAPEPADLLQALREVVVDPSHHAEELYVLSSHGPTPYSPARTEPVVAWTLALRFDGTTTGQAGMIEGPGNFALAHDGTMWVAINYLYADPSDPTALACASDQVARFGPDGSFHPGSPYTGGGLSGAGYGIAIDPYGDVWVSNFGFAAVECPEQPPHDTLSQFSATGQAISPAEGYAADGISWPQGMEFDDDGNLWVANCLSDSVTYLPDGDPDRARSFDDLGVQKPFDVAFGSDGNTYVTGTFSNNVAVASPDGSLVASYEGLFNRPMGIAADQDGKLWVADSGIVDLPCPDKSVESVEPHNLGFIDPVTSTATTFSGGGLLIPWGVSVDGHGNVWVSNFGGGRLSAFCGRDDSPWCPEGSHRGSPLSPELGYTFDGLYRATATLADTAGNVWVTNNFKEVPPPRNPGGYQVVVFLGLAGPLETPAPQARPVEPVVVGPAFTG